MQKQNLYIVLCVLALGVGGVVLVNVLSGPDAGGTPIRTTEQVIENPEPAVQARGNTFGIMTAEEKAAADAEAARRAEEAALASSTASSTASTTDETAEETEE